MKNLYSTIDIQYPDLQIFKAVPGNNLLIMADSPHFTIIEASDGYIKEVGKSKAELIGKGVFEAFPSNPDNPQASFDMLNSYHEVIATKKVSHLPVQQYDVLDQDNNFITRYWRITNSPVTDNEDNVVYIINSVEEITHQIMAEQQVEKMKYLQKAHNLLMQAPMSIQIFKGTDLIIELANDPTLKMWDRDESAIGKPFLEVLPELKGEGYEHMMAEVMETGIAKSFYEVPIYLNKRGKRELGYYNFLYQPYYEEDKAKAVGVLVFSNEVTEQIITREKVKESEQRLDMAIEIAGLGVYNVDLRTRTASYTRQIMDWLSFKEQHLPMEEIFKKVYPEDLEMVNSKLESTFKKDSGGRHNFIFRIIHPENGNIYYLNSIGQVQFEGDAAVSIKGVMQNVTEQVLANQKLKENEQKLQSIIDNAPYAIAVLRGKEMRIELANQNILDVWGKGNAIGKTYYEVVPELGSQEVFEHLNKSFETGQPIHIRQQHLHFIVDGEKVHYYFNYSFIPLFDDSGNVYATTVTAADVTDLIEARQKVEESSANLTNMIMQAPVAMSILKEPSHIVEIANDRQLELWGMDRERVMKKPLLQVLSGAKEQGMQEILDKVYTTGETFSAYELPFSIYRNGQMESLFINIEHRPYRETDGKIVGIMTVATEVTELVLARQKIEEVVAKRTRQLAEVNYALQQNNRELEQFAYVAAHDLQEPLRTISNFVGLFVKKYGSLDTDAGTYARFIINATRRMQNLIKDLLDYSTIRSNVPFVTVHLKEVLNEVINDLSPIIKETKASIISTEMPGIKGNAIELKRVFQHLLSNAIKFHKENKIPEVKISAIENDKEHLISVEDNGIGIEKEYMDKLFVIFQQLHNTEKYSGTGIGLAICKKIIDLHGGKIWVESEAGVGTTFFFTIPKITIN